MGGGGGAIKKLIQVAVAPVTAGISLTQGGSQMTDKAMAMGQNLYDTTVKGQEGSAPAIGVDGAPPAPGGNNDAADQAAEEARKNRGRGRASTYLTGSSGVTTSATTAGRTLLGS